MTVVLEGETFGTQEVARVLGFSAMTVVRWVDNGLIPAYRTPGNHRRILRNDLRHFVRRMGFPMPVELRGDRHRVLIVDDEEEVLEVLCRTFSGPVAEEYEVFTASDGVSAMIEIGRLKPDVLLLDIILPGMNGIEVCRRIKDNGHLTTRIVAISGKATEEMRQEIIAAGADLFIEKPVSIHSLRQQVSGLVEE